MLVSLQRWRAEIGMFIGSSRCCVRYARFSLNGLFIAVTSLLKLSFLFFGYILIIYWNLCRVDYIFYFSFISLTSGSNYVWDNSYNYHSTCKHLNLCNSIISKFLFYPHLILLQHDNIESNPGPDKTKLKKDFSCCHWIVNSLLAHSFSKFRQLKAYNSLYDYDFICTPETYLDSSVTHDNEKIQLDGYSSKGVGVCLYYEKVLRC